MKKATLESVEQALGNSLTMTLITRKSQNDEAEVESFDSRNGKLYEGSLKKAQELASKGTRCLLLVPSKKASEQMFGTNFQTSNAHLTLSQRGGVQRSADVFFIQKGMHKDAVMAFAFAKEGWNKPLNQILMENANTNLASAEEIERQRFMVRVQFIAKKYQQAYEIEPGQQVWLQVPLEENFKLNEDPLSPGYMEVTSGKCTLFPYTF